MAEKNENNNIDEYYASRKKQEIKLENESVQKNKNSEKIPLKYKLGLAGGAVIFTILAIFAFITTNPRKRPTADTNVIIITLDAVRADSIAPFARDKFVFTPNIAELAKKSYTFSNVRTTNPLTLPAHASMLTGRYPLAHKIRDNRNFKLPAHELSLAEIMKDNGYKTGAFVSAATTAGELGLKQGFDEYDDSFLQNAQNNQEIVIPERRADETLEKAINWLKKLDKQDKFFSWIHLFDAHYPYAAPKDYRPTDCRRAFLKDLPSTMQPTNYDAEITYMDICLIKLLNYLVESGKMEDTVIVITSDHGEGLQEHAESTHGFFAYDTTIRIPLIVFFPEKFRPIPLESNANLSIVDIAPTLIDVLELEMPDEHPEINGLSFKSLFEPESNSKNIDFSKRCVYFESFYPLYAFNYAPVIGLRDDEHTYLYTNPSELYLTTDSNQSNNIISEVNSDALRDKFRDIFAQFKRQSPGNPFNIVLDKTGDFNRNSYMPSLHENTKDSIKTREIIKENQSTKSLIFNAEASLDIDKNLVSPMLKADEIKKYELAEQTYSQELYNQTITTLKELISANPEHAPSYLLLTSCFQKIGRNSLNAKINAKLKTLPDAKPQEIWVRGEERAEVLENYQHAADSYSNYIKIIGKRDILSQQIKENAGILNFLAGDYTKAQKFLDSATSEKIDLSNDGKLMLVLSLHYQGKTFETVLQLDEFVPAQGSDLYKLYELMTKFKKPEELNPYFNLP